MQDIEQKKQQTLEEKVIFEREKIEEYSKKEKRLKEDVQSALKQGYEAQMEFYETIEKDFKQLDQASLEKYKALEQR